jgi:Uma2 family endonuclease
MPSSVQTTPALVTGDRMSLEEFLCLWEELPDLKNAELIDGVVYVPSPLRLDHTDRDSRIIWWLKQYEDATPGCHSGNNVTWFMLGSAPQPDAFLRILPEHGGQSLKEKRKEKHYATGAPELAVEICLTSTEIDFGAKLRLYQRAGVREYITIEDFHNRLVWRLLENGVYVDQPVPADGIYRSHIFPGLWLDIAAFWADDGPKMLAALNTGLATPDHQRFVERLAAAKS